MKKVAIYKRVSTREQALEGYSLDAQERVLREYCKARKWHVYDVYADEGISGGTTEKRPSFLKMISDAKEKQFEIILVWKLTRFSRNLADLANVCEGLDKYGISLVSYSEAFDCSTPAGRMVRNMLGTVSQFEREVMAENIALGLHERARQGKPIGSMVLGYNRDKANDRYVINEEEARRIKFIFDTYRLCKNLSQTAEIANTKGMAGKRGKPFSSFSIFGILTCKTITGYTPFKGHLYKGLHEAIISPQDFNRMQRTLIRYCKNVGQTRKKNITFVPEK